ncbi:MAG: FAD-binding oxidoreductase [Acidobacteria bacterium]|nr:FAD-binding oxidoreductase [Acidobacteriota bacterium]
MTTVVPASAADVAAVLRDATARRHAVLIRGGGTKLDWGRPPRAVDVVLDMRGINRVLTHQHGDLTATFEAGITLREANAALAAHGQWLPLDSAFPDEATIGGLLATNDSGALRHRFGTPRDLVIGVQICAADGTLAKAGGQVVKNVAGYDLGRLVAGSFGSLGAIVSATFKLSPLPAASKTLRVTAPGGRAIGDLVKRVMASQLEPLAFDVTWQPAPAALHIRFGSRPEVVDAQVEQARAMLRGAGGSTEVIEADEERRLWREQQMRPWSGSGAVARMSWLPANLSAVLSELRAAAAPVAFTGRAAIGAGFVRIGANAETQARVLGRLRESPVLGNVVLLRGSDELKARVDPWGPMGDRVALLAAVKRALDPHDTLNAGRGPV